MPKTIDPIYKKYVSSVAKALANNDFYEYFMAFIAAGKTEFNFSNRRLEKEVDETWVREIEAVIKPMQEIINNPRNFIIQEEIIVNVALAKKVTPDTIRHLAQHGDMIDNITEDGVRPNRLMEKFKEDSWNTYENKFVYTLLEMTWEFVDKRYEAIFAALNEELGAYLQMSSLGTSYQERVSINMDMRITQEEDLLSNDSKNESIFSRIARLHRILGNFRTTTFAKQMQKFGKIRPPLVRTNAIAKNPNFKACHKLWNFILAYHDVGYNINIIEQSTDIDADFLQDIYNNIYVNYIILKNHLESNEDKLIDASKPFRKKAIRPHFNREIVEEFVKDYDEPDVEIRKVLVEEITMEKLMQEEENVRIRLVKEKEREMQEIAFREEEERRIRVREERKEQQRLERERKREAERLERERKKQEEKEAKEKAKRELAEKQLAEQIRAELDRVFASRKDIKKLLADQQKRLAELRHAEEAAAAQRVIEEQEERDRLAKAQTEAEQLAAEEAERDLIASEAADKFKKTDDKKNYIPKHTTVSAMQELENESDDDDDDEDIVDPILRGIKPLYYLDVERQPEEYQVELERERNGEIRLTDRYRRSFEARLCRSEDFVKDYYSIIKNTVLAYKGTKSRASWEYESFSAGKNKICRLNARLKTLYVYLALDTEICKDSKYQLEDVSSTKKYAETPVLLKVTGERKFKYVMELIEQICSEKYGLTKMETEMVDYRLPKQSKEELIHEGKIIHQVGIIPVEMIQDRLQNMPEEYMEDSDVEYVEIEDDYQDFVKDNRFAEAALNSDEEYEEPKEHKHTRKNYDDEEEFTGPADQDFEDEDLEVEEVSDEDLEKTLQEIDSSLNPDLDLDVTSAEEFSDASDDDFEESEEQPEEKSEDSDDFEESEEFEETEEEPEEFTEDSDEEYVEVEEEEPEQENTDSAEPEAYSTEEESSEESDDSQETFATDNNDTDEGTAPSRVNASAFAFDEDEEESEIPEEATIDPRYRGLTPDYYIDVMKKPEEYKVLKEREEAGEIYLSPRYRASFEARLSMSMGNVQDMYSEIKNLLLSFKGVKSRLSWDYETFNFGRNKVAKINARYTTLYLYLGIDPSVLSEQNYPVEDVSGVRKYDGTPTLIRIRGDRKLKYALEIIKELCSENLHLKQNNNPEVDYRQPVLTRDELIQQGKILHQVGVIPIWMLKDEYNENYEEGEESEILSKVEGGFHSIAPFMFEKKEKDNSVEEEDNSQDSQENT